MRYLLLYAEDEKDFAELKIRDFYAGGYDVIWAKDGQETLDLYKEHMPDLLLLDIKMPRLSGYQVAEEIRRKKTDIPIVFLTSHSDEEHAVEGFRLGACDYIRKNTGKEEMLIRIQRILQDRRFQDRLLQRDPVIQITPDTNFNLKESVVVSCGKSVKLSFSEHNLLYNLLLNKNRKQKRDRIIFLIWGDSHNGENAMNKAITKLRNAISDDPRIQLLSIRGDGIVLEVHE